MAGGGPDGCLVNDWHTQLNGTRVRSIARVDSLVGVRDALSEGARGGTRVSICGGRHAMGGQQFGTDTLLLDTESLHRVLGFDPRNGVVEAEAGIQWPELIEWLAREQEGRPEQWGIIQKQTGADALSLGGALSANVHSRGLRMQPIVGDVEAFTLVDAAGVVHRCTRDENPELFRLAVGGYGLFGVIYSVRLRLSRRRKVERVVEIADVEQLMQGFEERIRDGFVYGDFQYFIDEASEDYLRTGIFSCYRPVSDDTPIPEEQLTLNEEDWREIVYLGHTDKTKAYERYADYYLSSSGQVYWSDTHQLIPYDRNYHRLLDQRLGAANPATEMITEIFVPRNALAEFMTAVRGDFRRNRVNVVYGTIRLIEREDDTFLCWAREPWVCIIFNLHVEHTPEGLERSTSAFRRLIDIGRSFGGSYYLTYHRWATLEQLVAGYPQFPEFLRRKRQYDPDERFQSDWYRHYRDLLAGS